MLCLRKVGAKRLPKRLLEKARIGHECNGQESSKLSGRAMNYGIGAVLYLFWDGFSVAGVTAETGSPDQTFHARPRGEVFHSRPRGEVFHGKGR